MNFETDLLTCRDYFSKPPKSDVRFEDILCKREIQNWFLKELGNNLLLWKQKEEPIIYELNLTEKRHYPRLDLSAAYMVSNTYQTQLALSGPNPQYPLLTTSLLMEDIVLNFTLEEIKQAFYTSIAKTKEE